MSKLIKVDEMLMFVNCFFFLIITAFDHKFVRLYEDKKLVCISGCLMICNFIRNKAKQMLNISYERSHLVILFNLQNKTLLQQWISVLVK